MKNTKGLWYKKMLVSFAQSSTHIDSSIKTIVEQIIPKLKKTDSMIDIGAGIGAMTKRLKPFFKEVTALDVNPEVKSRLLDEGFKVEIGDLLEFKTAKKFDLVICSHVLYLMDEDRIRKSINKLFSLIDEGGYCFIALTAPRGCSHPFLLKYNADYINSMKVVDVLKKEKISFQIIEPVPNRFRTQDKLEMKDILKFSLIANCSSSLNEQQIDNLVEKEVEKSKTPSGYEYAQQDDYIIINGQEETRIKAKL